MSRIGKIKFKSGGEVKILPTSNHNYTRIDLGWGEVVCRLYDDKPISAADLHYMLDAAKDINMNGEGDD